jgi:TfoX/Sxy family transcriptional regulator of competence genes
MSAAKKKSNIPAEKSELYDKLIATHPRIERKGVAMGYTSLNGNMFTLMGPSGTLALRLAEADRGKFLKKYGASLYEAYGTVMKEYVAVPDALLEKTNELKKYLATSYDYVATLKPKATKKKH